MNIPGFTAEAAVNGSRGYWFWSNLCATNTTIIPQLSGSQFAACFVNCVQRGGGDPVVIIQACNAICSWSPFPIVFVRGGIASL